MIKLESAGVIPKSPLKMLEYASAYYHGGRGKEMQKKWLARRTPEQIEARKRSGNAWKRRNVVRIGLLRFGTNAKSRFVKRCPALAAVGVWDLLGCNVLELQRYLESQFRDGLSWENRRGWEIDHIRPLCEFDLSDEAQARECAHFTNLQVLERGTHHAKAGEEMKALFEKRTRAWWSANRTSEFPGWKVAWGEMYRRTVD